MTPRSKYDYEGQSVSRHVSVEGAYAELDLIGDRLRAGGLAPDTIEFYVVDEDNHLVRRPGTH